MNETATESREKDVYFVAVKVLLRDGDKLLLIKDIYDDGWDLPGGRIKKDEFETALNDIVKRKMLEEVGEVVRYTLDPRPKVFFRHERHEVGLEKTVRIFALGYEANYDGGEILLGKYMDRYEWVKVSEFEPEQYLRGGWLRGVKEYVAQTKAAT